MEEQRTGTISGSLESQEDERHDSIPVVGHIPVFVLHGSWNPPHSAQIRSQNHDDIGPFSITFVLRPLGQLAHGVFPVPSGR